MQKKFIIAIILTILFFNSISNSITLEEALKIALEKSEASKIAFQTTIALKESAKQSIAFTKPQLTMGAGYLRMNNNSQVNPYIKTPESNISLTTDFSQLLWAGGKIWKSLELKKALYQQSDIIFKSLKRDIRKNVKFNFYKVLYQKALLEVNKDRVKYREEELKDAKDLKDVGMVTTLDVRQAKINLNVALNELKSAEESYKKAIVDFNIAIGRDAKGNLVIPQGKLSRPKKLKATIKKVEEKFLQDSLIEIESAKLKFFISKLNYKIANAERMPELYFIASAKLNGEDINNMDDSWSIGIKLKWNIFDGGLSKAKKSSALAEMISSKEKLSKIKKELSGIIKNLKITAETVDKMIKIQQENLQMAKENYEDARGHYRAGTITITQLGETNLHYTEAKFNLLKLFFIEQQLLIQAEALIE